MLITGENARVNANRGFTHGEDLAEEDPYILYRAKR